MIDKPLLDRLAEATALDILRRYAPDCLDPPGLRAAIARLASLGMEGYARLYQQAEPERPRTWVVS